MESKMEQRTNWEYKTVKKSANHGFFGGKTDISEMDSRLNELGGNGWELVSSFVTHMGYGSSREVCFVFKKPVQGRF